MMLPSRIGIAYGKQLFGEEWVFYPWLKYVEQRILDAVLDDTRERHIIVNAPPQTGKSSYCGILLPFWLTGMFPDRNLMYISYSDSFSVSKGKDVRQLHETYGQDLFGVTINPDYTSGSEWRLNDHRGGMLSVGIGGLITGKPGHFIIVDDLIKSSEDASSTAIKEKHLKEWDSTIQTRLQPNGTVIIIATRWAEDDLTGSLLERMKQPGYDGPKWEVLSFPAFAEPPEEMDGELTPEEEAEWRDLIGREYGEVLDCRFSRIEGREPDDFFRLARNSRDPLSWACLYQQRPFSPEGSMFPKDAWKYYNPDERPDLDELIRCWDLASTAGGGDWTVGTKMGRLGGELYVLDVQRFRKASNEVMDAVIDQAPIDGFNTKIKVEEEKGAAGASLIATLAKLLPSYLLEPAKAEGDKKSRATPWSACQRGGHAWLPEPDTVDWDVRAFVSEHARMMQDGRRPRHDDQIDTAAYCALELIGSAEIDLYIPGAEGTDWLSPQAQMNLLELQGFVVG